jgi:hypothetical protein
MEKCSMNPTRKFTALLGALLFTVSSTTQAEVPKDPKERLAKAQAMFAERCKKAGKFIYRTVDNVEGIVLLKLRSDKTNYGENEEQQYRLDDPFGRDAGGESYIGSFLAGAVPKPSYPPPNWRPSRGYRYVDVPGFIAGQRFRYTGRIDQPWLRDKRYGEWVREFVLDKTPAPDPAPRYGVTFDDLSTTEERDYWIAGSSLRVIDLQTNEVIAERIGYMMDPGQGNNSGGRSPWLIALNYACPAFEKDGAGHANTDVQSKKFVIQVLSPIEEK